MAWPAFANRRQNPYNALLYTALRDKGVSVSEFSVQRLLFGPRADILHLHWAPTNRIRAKTRARARKASVEMLLLLKAARLRGMKIVWTAHNLDAHDQRSYPDLEKNYWPRVAERLNALISLSHSGVDILREMHPSLRSVPSFVTAHGSYRGAYPRTFTRDQARAILGICPHARVISSLGQVRPYKNLPALLRAFSSLDDSSAVLLIAGKVKLGDKQAEFDRLVAADPRVRVFRKFIPTEDVQLYLEASDLVVLPYRETLNSGSAVLALSFDRPVLVPRQGSRVDLSKEIGNRWVMTYDGELTTARVASALNDALTMKDEVAPLESLDWSHIADQTRDIYKSLLA